MGLSLDHFRFDGAPPDPAALRVEVRRRLGGDGGLHGLSIEGRTVEALCLLDPYTRLVVCAAMQERGGRLVDTHGRPIDSRTPAWARRPVREMTRRERWAVRRA